MVDHLVELEVVLAVLFVDNPEQETHDQLFVFRAFSINPRKQILLHRLQIAVVLLKRLL